MSRRCGAASATDRLAFRTFAFRSQASVTMSSSARAAEIDGDETENVGSQHVAAVYAKAFLGATETAGTTDAVLAELDSLVERRARQASPAGRGVRSALVSADEKIEIARQAVRHAGFAAVAELSQGARAARPARPAAGHPQRGAEAVRRAARPGPRAGLDRQPRSIGQLQQQIDRNASRHAGRRSRCW